LKHAEKINAETNVKIVKEGSNYIMKTELTQTVEDLLIELMSLQDEKPRLLERLVKQNQVLTKYESSKPELESSLEEIKQRLTKIKIFFAGQHKNIDKLLDVRAQARKNKDKIAESGK